MGRGARAAAVLGASGVLLVLAAGPAAAGQGERRPAVLTPVTCTGAFDVTAGVRSCTTVTSAVVEGALVTARLGLSSGSFPGGSYRDGLEGTSRRTSTVETVQRQEQRGAGAVALTTSERVVASDVVPVSCELRSEETFSGYVDRVTGQYVEGFTRDTRTAVDLSVCAARGLFTA